MPIFNSLFPSWRSSISPQQALKLAKFYLASAGNADELAIAFALCEQAEISLNRIKRPKSSSATESDSYRAFREEVAAAYNEHARFMAEWKYPEKEQASRTKSEKWGGIPSKDEAVVPDQLAAQESPSLPDDIFDTDDARPITIPCELPEVNKPLTDTTQLAYCLAALYAITKPEIEPPAATREWIETVKKDGDEEKRLKDIAKNLVRAFTRDEFKDADAVAEVTFMAPALDNDDFRFLLKLFVNNLKDSAFLELHSLEGITRLLSSAPGAIEADDLVRTLHCINTSLQVTHSQSEGYIYELTTTVSRVLDAMADCHVIGIARENLQEPLRNYLEGLKGSDDPYLVFHAAYAFQALLRVPNDESPWQETQRKVGRILNGAFQLVGAVKALDVNSFIHGLYDIQNGLGEIYDVAKTIKDAYFEVKSLCSSGEELKAALRDISFKRPRAWYTALRGADTLLRNGQLAEFKRLVCETPCRCALAFQWGVCLRLGNLAVDPQWDEKHRRDAVAFLGHLYQDDVWWGQYVTVKQLILDILMQLSTSSESVAQAKAEALLEEFKGDENLAKRAMFLTCQKSGPSSHPLMAAVSPPSSSTLLERAQGKVEVEADLKRLRLACEQRRVKAVYIPPKAKSGLQAHDTDLFDLKKKADDFIANEEHKVLLLLGESGVGKSTFNMELEHQLWSKYEKHKGRIPLFINLPAVYRPEHDLIAKQLRKFHFEEPQIRELKKRKFVLICDGYDEGQQTHNLYTSNRLNQEGEWQAQMVISCRSEYIGVDYKDRFQPGDRNQSPGPGQFHEAVVMPFSADQIENYIEKFVELEEPLWTAQNYSSVLANIPSLRELVKNPFLLKLSLDVLPRLVEPDQKNLADAKVTRVALYDQFVEQWLERGKRRLVDKDMSEQERRAFDSLSDEGFALHGIAFIKRLAADVYENQGGNPVIEYSRVEVEGSWKDKYFSRNDDIRLLRDACPLTRSGNQYRFVHRSILEYGVARAAFEPQNGGIRVEKTEAPIISSKRRGSVDSAYSFVFEGALHDIASLTEQGPSSESPLVRRSFVGEPSVLQFLKERAQQEPVFKAQLLAYVHASKNDKAWRVAAANAITILVRAGEQFNGADLKHIRIPGADLSFGVFDSANLQEADLRKVKLSNVWLGRANLSGAKMSGIEFGELQEDGAVSLCIYSPDGKTLMAVLENGGANVYSTRTWEKQWGVDRDVKIDPQIAFSPNSDLTAFFISLTSAQEEEALLDSRLASKNKRDVIHLRETASGHCRTLLGHTSRISSIAFSPKGDIIASCSMDGTIRLWNTLTGTCGRSLNVGRCVYSIAFSPKGDRLASVHLDEVWRLWNSEADSDFKSLRIDGCLGLEKVLFSPAGTKIALKCQELDPYDTSSRSMPRHLYLWDVQSKTHSKLDNSHAGFDFTSVVFSPEGRSIAIFGLQDGTVHIWNTETAKSRHVLRSNGEGYLAAAFSPKGDLVVTGGKDQMVQLWDVETGVCRASMSGHSGIIRSVTFSPDGRYVASSGDDERVRLWEVGTGAAHTNASGVGHTQLSVGRSPLDESIVSVSGGDTVHVWNMSTGECPQSLTRHGAKVRAISLSPNGCQVASGTTDGEIHLWNLENGVCSQVMSISDKAVNSIAYSQTGDFIASGSGRTVSIRNTGTGSRDFHQDFSGHDEKGGFSAIAYSPKADQFASAVRRSMMVRLWDEKVGTCRILHGHSGFITSLMYSTKRTEIASASKDKTVRLWDTESGLCRLILSDHVDEVYEARYSPNEDEIVSCSKDNTIRVWNVETGSCRLKLGNNIKLGIGSVAYSPTGDVIASMNQYGELHLWNVGTEGYVSSSGNGSSRVCLRRDVIFSPRGDLIITFAYSWERNLRYDVMLWNVSTSEPRRRRSLNETCLGAAAPVFSPRGSQIAFPESKAAVRVQVWDVDTLARLYTLNHEGMIKDVQYSPEGDLIASASKDKTVRLWNTETGVCLYTIQNYRSGVERLAFSPTGARLVLGGEDGSIRLWNTSSETLRRYFDGHEGTVNCVVFAPDRHLVASASDDTTVCLWNLDIALYRHVFEGHTAGVLCVAFSPLGNCIASGSKDKSIRLWDIKAETCCLTMTGASDEIWCLAYSANGELLASGTSKMSVYLWNVASGQSWAVIEGTYGNVTSVSWGIAGDARNLVIGSSDTSVRVWRVEEEEEEEEGLHSVTLQWSSSHSALLVAGCNVQGVRGLTEANKRLLKQGGALGDPAPRLTFKKAGAMALAATKLQQLRKTDMITEE